MNEKPETKIGYVSPLKKLCMTIGELPTSYLETMTYYEMLVWFVEFLKNQVIPVVNNNSQATQELQTLFIELQNYVNNYFDNLDVQEEINNKLDEMVEDGTLDQIIEQYLNSSAIWGFDTIQDLKNATNLINGSFARTLGYHNKNDDGGALYKIRTITNEDIVDNGRIVSLYDNSLIAELISNKIYPEMFGAYGDGTHNDTQAFTKIIELYNEMYLNNKTYKITSLAFNKNFIVHGNKATLIDDSSNIVNDNFIESTIGVKHTLYLNDLNIELTNSNVGIYILHATTYANNIKVKGANNANISVNKGTTSGAYGSIELTNSRIENSDIGVIVNATDCNFFNIISHNCMTHYQINGGLTHLNRIHGWNFNSQTKDWVTGSLLFEANSSIIGSDIYCDTLETCIKLPSTNYHGIILNNISMFLNTSSYPSTQNPPQLLSNIDAFIGNNSNYCRINGFYFNSNNWRDSESLYPLLVPNVMDNKITISNVGQSGTRNSNNRVIPAYTDIQTSEFTNNNTTYLTLGTRKVKLKDYSIKIYMRATLKTALTNGNQLLEMDFSNSSYLNVLDKKAKVDVYFDSTTTPGLVYKLDGFISDSHILYIYNHTGVNLNNGEVIINIDYDKITLT